MRILWRIPKRKNPNRPKVRYIEGESMNSIWVNRSLGIDPATGNELFLAKNGGYRHGMEYRQLCDRRLYRFGIGRDFRNKLSVERISVEYDIPLQPGGQIYNQTLVDKVQDADLRGNVDRRVFEERWQKPGDKVMFTKFGPGINANATSLTKPTSRFIEDNNYLELSTLNLSYEFGMPWMKKVGLKRLKVLFI